MVICNCNYLTSGDIAKACGQGIKKVDAVFSCFSKKECCGQCVPEIRKFIESQILITNPEL